MRINNKYYIVVLLILTFSIGCVSLKSDPEIVAKQKLTKEIRLRMSHVERFWRSKTSYIPILFAQGTIIAPKPMTSSEPAYIFPDAGYLVFYNDAPKSDWEHPARLYFLPKSEEKEPILIFRDRPSSWFDITDGNGRKIISYTSIPF